MNLENEEFEELSLDLSEEHRLSQSYIPNISTNEDHSVALLIYQNSHKHQILLLLKAIGQEKIYKM